MSKIIQCLLVAALALALPGIAAAQAVAEARLTTGVSGSNQNPPIDDLESSGTGYVIARFYATSGTDLGADFTDALYGLTGEEVSADGVMLATARFVVNVDLANDEMITAMHVHYGTAGNNGPVVINSGLSGPIAATAGPNSLNLSVTLSSAADIEQILQIVRDPSRFYLNIHTMTNPGGHLRGQLRLSPGDSNTKMSRQLTRLSSVLYGLTMKVDMLEGALGATKGTLDRVAARNGVIPVPVP